MRQKPECTVLPPDSATAVPGIYRSFPAKTDIFLPQSRNFNFNFNSNFNSNFNFKLQLISNNMTRSKKDATAKAAKERHDSKSEVAKPEQGGDVSVEGPVVGDEVMKDAVEEAKEHQRVRKRGSSRAEKKNSDEKRKVKKEAKRKNSNSHAESNPTTTEVRGEKTEDSNSVVEPSSTSAGVKKTEISDSIAGLNLTTIDEKTDSVAETNPTSPETHTRKRKRDLAVPEIEIDVDLPEPSSKKALRRLKKNPSLAAAAAATTTTTTGKPGPKHDKTGPKSDKPEEFPEHASQSRSKWGIWIGNLSFSVTAPQLEELLTKAPSTIQRIEIVRINLPVHSGTGRNQGYAYIDFSNENALAYALSLTETLYYGRRVLIKDAKDFSNRNAGNPGDGPKGPKGPKLGPNLVSKPPSNILFVGNLDFATTDKDLKEHFEFAGKIVGVRLATFEDTGKCKGFGFVDFENIESTQRALRGLSENEELMRNFLEGKEEKELAERQKKRRFIGPRQLKMEFGEDSTTRYKKRFRKDKPDGESEDAGGEPPRKKRAPKQDEDWAEQAWQKKRAKIDSRSTDPGAAYSNDVRRTGAITQSTGKKMSFAV